MNWEIFMKGITVLYAFGLATKDDWELKIWYQALKDEIEAEEYERACFHLCKKNSKFWETDNVPAQLIEVVEDSKANTKMKLLEAKAEDDEQRRQRERQEALDSWGSEEERLTALAKIFKLNRKIFKGMPKHERQKLH